MNDPHRWSYRESAEREFRRYGFMSMMNAAISWASLRLSGTFGMVACGRRRNEAIISEVIFSLAAIVANGCARLNLAGAGPMAWHCEHHRSDSRRPFSRFCAKAAAALPNRVSATER